MRRVSAARGIQLQLERQVAFDIAWRARGRCECTEDDWRCPNDGIEKHEILTRARGGDPTDPLNCLWICRWHHDWIHAHPAEAEEKGWLRHSWNR